MLGDENALCAHNPAPPNTPPHISPPSAALATLRDTLEEELAGIVCNNPRALDEFLARKREIEELGAEVAREEAEINDLNAEIDDIKVRAGAGYCCLCGCMSSARGVSKGVQVVEGEGGASRRRQLAL